jgi:uncharacterized membrane protein YfhO
MASRPPGRGLLDHCSSRLCLGLLIGLVLVIACFVFADFLFLDNVYLFKDIGSDSINSTYPRLVHYSRYLRTAGLPGWSFNQGMGQNLFPFMLADNFLGLLLLLPPGMVAYGVIYVEVLKALLAAILFYLYLRTLSLSPFACVVGGLLYAFSGYVVLGGCWSIFSTEAVLAALLLYSFEQLLRRQVWLLLPLAIALLGVHQPVYWFCYSLFILVYGTTRFLQEGTRRLPAFYLKLLALGLLGVAISAVFSFSNILQLAQSPRAAEASVFHEFFSQPMFRPAGSLERSTTLLRLFSNDLLGVGNSFQGYRNYMEAPLLYCGLASLLLAPHLFYYADRRRKLIYGAVVLLCAVPLLFPFFRWAFWGFSGDYYRTLSLLVVVFLLWFSLQSLSLLDRTGRLSPWLLAGTLATLLAFLFCPFLVPGNLVLNTSLRTAIAWSLAGYALLAWLMSRPTLKLAAQAVFLVLVCVELIGSSTTTLSRRPVISTGELQSKAGYNDYSVEAIDWLHATDTGFFRVAKTYCSGPAESGSLNDALIQNYCGTCSYSGFNQLSYVRFLGELGVRNAADNNETHWIVGFEHPLRPVLLTWASVKYALTRQPEELISAGYTLTNQFGDVSVLENDCFLPLGYTYDKYVTYRDFKGLTPASKEQLLLQAFVAGDDNVRDCAGLQPFDPRALPGKLTPEGCKKAVAGLKADALSLTEHGQNRLAGTIDLKRPKLVFFSIPYDQGWKARVDGVPADLKRVNIGFMGLLLTAGHHRVELQFVPPLLHAGAAASGLSLLGYGLLAWRGARFRRLNPADEPQERPTGKTGS